MKKKFIIALSSFTLLGGMAIGAGAAPILEKITANLNWGINYSISGKTWSPVDQNGKKLAAITYNNTTYLPVRSVGEALGVAVDYNNSSQTLMLGEKTDTTPITSEKIEVKHDSFVTKDKQFTVQDKDYQSGVVIKEVFLSQEFTLIPEGKYQTIELSVFPVKMNNTVSLKVFDGDTLLKEFEINASSGKQTASFDIGGVKKLKFTADLPNIGFDSQSVFVTGSYK
ncbi:stalk domain-containing protein [Paenibacillus taichungensis]|uniref:Copper amine oxidase-like protein n=2 Tax=Paenibacillus TaxID=44249 RepID=A0A855Y2J6_9BACL|nr:MULTISPECIES: stalk domain-containing protein [Paenibacillus]MEC0110235.1 stalk domain-containing protein [Paenibacillus taichungensis]MEC0199330.1 stalk domain-containing protein [Paenibacillus taichungensis]NUU53211.1 copper amine oxidase [Paenibacillus taichungensis]OME77518.1 copper amine oxidase [Paenibacillus pabuli]PWW34755.1 copper amine oxidase-like protein [Paenibacillus pabuli]